MPSVERFREFFSQRLTAAAEEIFREFEKTMVEYEEEIRRQRELLVIACSKPEIKLRRLEQQQQRISEEEEDVEEDEKKETEEPGAPQIKEEEEELIQGRENVVVKQETDNIMLTLAYQEGDHSADQTVTLNTVKTSEGPQPNSYHPVLHQTSENEDSAPAGDTKTRPQRTRRTNTPQHYSAVMSTMSQSPTKNQTGKKPLKCDTCGKLCKDNYRLMKHQKVHTSKMPSSLTMSEIPQSNQTNIKLFKCDICGTTLKDRYKLKRHYTVHTDKKPYPCKDCDRSFRDSFDLKKHLTTHNVRNHIVVASVEALM